MGRLKPVILAALLASLPVAAMAQIVKAPSGWDEHADGNVRVLEKGTSLIEIDGWTDLGGQTLEEYMKANERRVPAGAVFKSSKGVKSERIDGAFAATRSIERNGTSGTSILYGCSGTAGTGRLMMLTADTPNFGDLMSGGLFIEKVCKKEPKGQATQRAPAQTAAASAPVVQKAEPKPAALKKFKPRNLATENARIPKRNRPVAATTVLESKLRGYPAMLVQEAKMMMTFPNGYSTYCSTWDLVNQSPTPSSIGREVKKCELTKEKQKKGSIRGFKRGETIDLKMGNISGTGYDLGGSSSSVINGGDLVMTKDGRIAIGKFDAFMVTSGGHGVGGHNAPIKVFGRYFLDGYTITIETDEGDIFHSFFGVSSNKNSRNMDHAYLGGEHYWVRD